MNCDFFEFFSSLTKHIYKSKNSQTSSFNLNFLLRNLYQKSLSLSFIINSEKINYNFFDNSFKFSNIIHSPSIMLSSKMLMDINKKYKFIIDIKKLFIKILFCSLFFV